MFAYIIDEVTKEFAHRYQLVRVKEQVPDVRNPHCIIGQNGITRRASDQIAGSYPAQIARQFRQGQMQI